MVPARWRIDEVADSTGISLPEAPEYDTVSGLVMRELGRVPEVGDRLEVVLPADGDEPAERPKALIEVLAVDRHVADSVRLTMVDAEDAGAQPPTTRGGGDQRRGNVRATSTGRDRRGGTNARGTGPGADVRSTRGREERS